MRKQERLAKPHNVFRPGGIDYFNAANLAGCRLDMNCGWMLNDVLDLSEIDIEQIILVIVGDASKRYPLHGDLVADRQRADLDECLFSFERPRQLLEVGTPGRSLQFDGMHLSIPCC